MTSKALKLYRKRINGVAIVYRKSSPPASKLARELAEWLFDRKIKVFQHPRQKVHVKAKPYSSKAAVELVVVLGGDGTYLEALRMLEGRRVPLLGVNMGSLGFLTVTRVQDLFPMVELAMEGKLELKTRSMIRIQVRRREQLRSEFTALNDLVIERGPNSHLIHIGLFVDKQPITTIKADGLIVGTPTGSTAYNLAAGGPILHPEVDATVVTPICPHSLTSRPFIFPNKRKIQFTLQGEKARAVLTVDGQRRANVGANDEIWVQRDINDHLFLRRVGQNFFSLLKEKLKFGERA